MPPTPRRRKCIHNATNVHVENYSGDHDVQFDNAHGDVQDIDDVFTQSLKDIICSHEIKGKTSLESIYSKLKEMFEPMRIETDNQLPTAKSHLANKHTILINESLEDNTITFVVLQKYTYCIY